MLLRVKVYLQQNPKSRGALNHCVLGMQKIVCFFFETLSITQYSSYTHFLGGGKRESLSEELYFLCCGIHSFCYSPGLPPNSSWLPTLLLSPPGIFSLPCGMTPAFLPPALSYVSCSTAGRHSSFLYNTVFPFPEHVEMEAGGKRG